MRSRQFLLALLAVVPLLFVSLCHADPTYTNPEETDEDFAYQGEYWGTDGEGDESVIVALQLVAQGDGVFLAKLLEGGLPGEGGEALGPPIEMQREGNEFTQTEIQDYLTLHLLIEGEVLTATQADISTLTLEKVHRESPTLGAEPPEGAVVLFDGTNLDHWQPGAEMTEDGLLKEGCTSTDEFGSHQLHLEFLLPYMPSDEGQARANSGCYIQGRYETQILDSFGLEGLENECGGIYNVAAPNLNMCYPPLTWQTYDFEFHAAQYDEAGELVAHPRMTVRHNGEVIHDNLELSEGTPGGTQAPGPGPGPIFLQNHHNPVRFRNIWALPLED